jgi:alcohol dehydrogenase
MTGRTVVFGGAGRPLQVVRSAIDPPRGAEVLVRVACCTLCRSDLHTHAGRRAEPTPSVLGHEVVGRIEAFGPDAAHVDGAGMAAKVGDRITWAVVAGCGTCFYCRVADLPQKCVRLYKYGHRRPEDERASGGGLADFVRLVPGTFWLRVPDDLPDVVAAPANCATATAAALVRHAGQVAGNTVVVLGAGVLGVTVCAMARVAGAAAVVVSDPVPDCRARAAQFGATHAFSAEPADVRAGVRELTDGRGADVVVELAGVAATVRTAMSLVRPGGTVLLAGTVAPVGTIELDPEEAVRRMLTIRGVHNYHPRDLSAAVAFLAGPGRGFPWSNLVAAEYPLEETELAFAHAHREPGARVAVRP